MNLATPWVLLLLIPWAFLGVFLYLRERERENIISQFMQHPMLARLAEGYDRRTAYLVLLLRLLGLACLIFTLAGPQWGSEMVKVERQAIDIFFVVDCSTSMAARDLDPDRMESAKRELSRLSDQLQGNRMGLIGFAGSAFVFCPLTLDVGATQLFLRQLDQQAVQVPGTAIGDAVRLALTGFPQDGDHARAIVLLTDGEDHHSEPIEAAKEAARKGVVLYCVGIGSPEGAKIPAPYGGYVRDDQGNTVISKLDEKTLREMAELTGGVFTRADGRAEPLAPIVKAINNSERQALESQMMLRYQDRFQIFLALTLVVFVLAQALAGRKTLVSQ
ncbi:MAG: VWA domain-containing protein [Vulcanimicrobiota bacterium]